MKRGFLWALILALCLPCAALGEAGSGFFTRSADLYYHYNEFCGGSGGMVPISQAAAQAFGKHVCPVCMPEEDTGGEIQAVVRGGTIVVRFPDARLAEAELTDVFGWSQDSVYPGDAGARMLAHCLHGESYNAFMAELQGGGAAQGRALEPEILSGSDVMIMSLRHIGGSWYAVARSDAKPGERWNMYWRINSHALNMQPDGLHIVFDRQSVESWLELPLGQMGDADPVYEYSEGSLRVEAYRAMDAVIAVVYDSAADADFLQDVQLRIGGADSGIEVTGYMNGKTGVYCCVLTEGELAALQSGAQAELWRRPLSETADYMGTPYAGARRGSGDFGVIDARGEFVVEAKYASVDRPDPALYRINAHRPFFCVGKDGSLTLLHGETLQQIVRIKKNDEILEWEYMNPAVFATRTENGLFLRSMTDGEILFRLKAGEDGSYTGDIQAVDGHYRVLANGLPGCMVAWQGAQPDTRAWLIDNHGNAVQDTQYQRVTPLIWSGNAGVFLVESYLAEDYDGSTFAGEKPSAYAYGAVYAGEAYGDNWRCGLIDQDGNAIAGTKYVSVEVAADGEIRMGRDDGGFDSFHPLEIQ